MTLRTRFLLLLALRWLATGLLLPVSLLLPLERGLTVAEVGLAMAAQGVVVLLCEVPSGALTDAWGRRPVFVASGVVAIAGYCVAFTAQSVLAFALAWAVLGLFRALDSGPLEAWFVDAEHARGAADEVPRGLAAAGGVISASLAAGALICAGLLRVSPWSAEATLAMPYLVAMGIVVVQIVCAWRLMDSVARSARPSGAAWRASLVSGVRVAFGRHLRLLSASMVLVGLGVAALELFMPVRLTEFSAGASSAASRLGVVSSAAWGLAALGAAITTRLLNSVGPAVLTPTLFVVEGLGLVAMAAATGVGILVAGYWLCYLVHTSSGAMYNSLVHRRVDDAQRGTALSVASMAFLGAGAAGGVGLGALGEATSASWALATGACFMIAAAVLVVAAVRRPQR
ncbi:MFS transporter [Aeromicrobium sp. 636]|uniref:MFS transporter n=1 Tax=Aeromicrobium senzhongii TaxID=2663859 RepID=A0A8I0EXT2_9ACTN|nr:MULTISPECIES: MFS transporter [Aeromicrobium]MBC9227367.1 MFS transporter [Aeromicrobium senzhongii]MCQ3999465.1 MFS transporter [Aeromicrobium sp. 636]MTB88223.1 MFS transporter [Aeromicrobium senzhongii]QNL94789.1 MFS transporter [Aeromicrobium senzhongii]